MFSKYRLMQKESLRIKTNLKRKLPAGYIFCSGVPSWNMTNLVTEKKTPGNRLSIFRGGTMLEYFSFKTYNVLWRIQYDRKRKRNKGISLQIDNYHLIYPSG